ncbi:MAG: cytochrome c3 family protein [Halobacteriovoraceae bacterium]|nr:cytochrome c3 family protein [Halobacteriovoraceae bacterium]
MKNKFIVLLGIVVFIGIGYLITKEMQEVSFNVKYEPQQPINFSHKIHAGENKIQCIYCHFAAEKGRHAGIPPVQLCLNCHSKVKMDSPEIKKLKTSLDTGKTIEWKKVHHFPDFAYFNHSQHVKVGKISCQECHGPVETMTRMRQEKMLNMGWCLNCHRQKGIAPPEDHKSRAGGDCARCHY